MSLNKPTVVVADTSTKETSAIFTKNQKEKIEVKINPTQYYVKFSFMITYTLLLTTATITIIEALRTKDPSVRHILNLETCISIVAGYFYSIFLSQISNSAISDEKIDWTEITKVRYIDWSITTPMMLLALCLVLSQNVGKSVKFSTIGTIVLLNYFMLYTGYMGEINAAIKFICMVAGFIAFFIMFYIIYNNFVAPKYSGVNYTLFFIYLTVWSMYGIVYMLPEEYKNISTNILDLIAKCLIGLGLWVYYTKIVSF